VSVTEFERHQLFSWFEEHMGRERATTMMNLVPPAGWGDVVTRRDLDQLAAITRRDLHAIEARIDAVETTLGARIDTLDSTVNARIDALEARLDAKLETRLSAVLRTFGTWLFASQAVVIAAVSVLIAFN
jgi:hypothetical protein